MIIFGDQLTQEPCELATLNEASDLIEKLEWELEHSKIPGIGLAAPQIGINKAVAIVRVPNPYDPTNPVHSINLVNPKLIDAYDLIRYNEGCLSFPEQSVNTIRFAHITIETADDYEYYAEQINARRYDRQVKTMPLFTNNRRKMEFGRIVSDQLPIQNIQEMVSVCVQHEASHLIGKDFRSFRPIEVGRNDKCPCNSGKKNKQCHNYNNYNSNLELLFDPKYT
jgi:peptide deformylase